MTKPPIKTIYTVLLQTLCRFAVHWLVYPVAFGVVLCLFGHFAPPIHPGVLRLLFQEYLAIPYWFVSGVLAGVVFCKGQTSFTVRDCCLAAFGVWIAYLHLAHPPYLIVPETPHAALAFIAALATCRYWPSPAWFVRTRRLFRVFARNVLALREDNHGGNQGNGGNPQ